MTSNSAQVVKQKHVWTPVEVGLVLFFSAMLIGMFVPRVTSAEEKANEQITRTSMHITQVALETYAADHNNTYPAEIDDALKSYYPGGEADGKTPASQGPLNPYSKKPEFPVMVGYMSTPTAVRSLPPESTGASPGQVVYIPLDNHRSYALLGTTGDGKAIDGTLPKTTLVLSNIW
ncbi:MAG: hypothetical protein C0464_00935 [Cyanobacteria bacterium DS2.008]|nr:hypothetical protein [Cyanobacteria bacterium DS2.008]